MNRARRTGITSGRLVRWVLLLALTGIAAPACAAGPESEPLSKTEREILDEVYEVDRRPRLLIDLVHEGGDAAERVMTACRTGVERELALAGVRILGVPDDPSDRVAKVLNATEGERLVGDDMFELMSLDRVDLILRLSARERGSRIRYEGQFIDLRSGEVFGGPRLSPGRVDEIDDVYGRALGNNLARQFADAFVRAGERRAGRHMIALSVGGVGEQAEHHSLVNAIRRLVGAAPESGWQRRPARGSISRFKIMTTMDAEALGAELESTFDGKSGPLRLRVLSIAGWTIAAELFLADQPRWLQARAVADSRRRVSRARGETIGVVLQGGGRATDRVIGELREVGLHAQRGEESVPFVIRGRVGTRSAELVIEDVGQERIIAFASWPSEEFGDGHGLDPLDEADRLRYLIGTLAEQLDQGITEDIRQLDVRLSIPGRAEEARADAEASLGTLIGVRRIVPISGDDDACRFRIEFARRSHEKMTRAVQNALEFLSPSLELKRTEQGTLVFERAGGAE